MTYDPGVPDTEFVSYAQHGEDVVLWRALGSVTQGRYVEVGANHPTDLSITRAFYDRGWSGVTIDPVQTFEALHREQRPRDTFVRAAVTDQDVTEIELNEFPGTGLSTLDAEVTARHDAAGREYRTTTVPARRLDAVLQDAGLAGSDIHFMTVDTEGAEPQVLASIDLTHWRPWVLVVESTVPLSSVESHAEWEPAVLAAGYTFCQFDGLSRWYVADEHAERLRAALSYPACPLDDYVRADVAAARAATERLTMARDTAMESLIQWRAAAIHEWAAPAAEPAAPASSAELEHLRRVVAELTHDLQATRATLSWRVTAPLRAGRRLTHRGA